MKSSAEVIGEAVAYKPTTVTSQLERDVGILKQQSPPAASVVHSRDLYMTVLGKCIRVSAADEETT